MQRLLASLLFVTLLTFGVSARADVGFDDEPIGRCTEAPISLALRVAEYEASRALEPASLTSPGTPVVATPAPRAARPTAAPARPFSAPPRACVDPSDPRCHVNALPPAPDRAQLEHAAHFAVLPPPGLVVPPSRAHPQALAYPSIEPPQAPVAPALGGLFRPPRA